MRTQPGGRLGPNWSRDGRVNRVQHCVQHLAGSCQFSQILCKPLSAAGGKNPDKTTIPTKVASPSVNNYRNTQSHSITLHHTLHHTLHRTFHHTNNHAPSHFPSHFPSHCPSHLPSHTIIHHHTAIIAQSSHNHHTIIAQSSHNHHTIITQSSHHHHTIITLSITHSINHTKSQNPPEPGEAGRPPRGTEERAGRRAHHADRQRAGHHSPEAVTQTSRKGETTPRRRLGWCRPAIARCAACQQQSKRNVFKY